VYDRAIKDDDESIKLNPKYARAYNRRGVAYYNKGDYARAIADDDQALRLNPQRDVARQNREKPGRPSHQRRRPSLDPVQAGFAEAAE
jgi:tetratricopeptide (TPR) repeat protein